MLYYAIGDIHGCAKSLKALVKKIKAHARKKHPGRVYKIICLGDYVDRGPDSAKVLDRVIKLQKAGHIILPGNHDWMMYFALKKRFCDHRLVQRWQARGGDAALESYGLTVEQAWSFKTARKAIPGRHRRFLKLLFDGRPIYHIDREDGLFFVHGGVQPELPLIKQSNNVMLWTRPTDRTSDLDPEWVEGLRVIHGHSPTSKPVIGKTRVGLDTAAAYGGKLSAGVFVDGTLTKVLSVRGWSG
jgi:serine/threonine protein phosphatase 1